jgi:hypothetical protein
VPSVVLRAEIFLSHEDFSARSTWGSGRSRRSPETTVFQPGGGDNEPLVPAPPGWGEHFSDLCFRFGSGYPGLCLLS